MYSEVVQVKFPAGIHNGTLDALRPFGSHGLKLQGMDPADGNSWMPLMQQFRDPSSQVELTVDNPDPQMCRDIATIARKMIWEGRNLWPGRVIPPDRFNQGANHIRMADGLPQEGPDQIGQQTQASVQKTAMYSETFPARFQIGLHNGSLDALLRTFSNFNVFINGKDFKSDREAFRSLQREINNKESMVEFSVDYPQDPQTERDIVTIAIAIIGLGTQVGIKEDGTLGTSGGGDGIPPDQLNYGANLCRKMMRKPQEGPNQVQDQTQVPAQAPQGAEVAQQPVQASHDKNSANDLVSGEMTNGVAKWSVLSPGKREAAWHVVALGEMQQPGGVGQTQGYNPVVDGPNPDGPDFLDAGDNSFEQQTALQTWVNYAVEMLNAGDADDVILAKLAHDGCDQPQEALQRAKMQPVEEMPAPVSDEIGQDPFKAPPAADAQTGQMESVSQQPQALGKRVRIANTSMKGFELDRWEDLWGQGTVKIALDDGGTMNVAPEAVEEIESEEIQHPVSQIQEFINGLPQVEPSRPHIEARIANMQLIRKACRENMQKVGFSDQVKLDTMDSDAQKEILTLKEFLGAVVSESDMAYLSGQQAYRPHGTNHPGIEQGVAVDKDFNKKIAEKAAIFVSELPRGVSEEDIAQMAARYAYENNANIPEFVRLALGPDGGRHPGGDNTPRWQRGNPEDRGVDLGDGLFELQNPEHEGWESEFMNICLGGDWTDAVRSEGGGIFSIRNPETGRPLATVETDRMGNIVQGVGPENELLDDEQLQAADQLLRQKNVQFVANINTDNEGPAEGLFL